MPQLPECWGTLQQTGSAAMGAERQASLGSAGELRAFARGCGRHAGTGVLWSLLARGSNPRARVEAGRSRSGEVGTGPGPLGGSRASSRVTWG